MALTTPRKISQNLLQVYCSCLWEEISLHADHSLAQQESPRLSVFTPSFFFFQSGYFSHIFNKSEFAPFLKARLFEERSLMIDLLRACVYSKLLKERLSKMISTDSQLRKVWESFCQAAELCDSSGNLLQTTLEGHRAASSQHRACWGCHLSLHQCYTN